MIDHRVGAPLTVKLKRGDEGVARVVVAGEIDLATVDEVYVTVVVAAQQSCLTLLDLGAVTFMDSTGVHLLEHLVRAADQEAWPFGVVAPLPSPVERVLRLSEVLAGVPTVEG